MLSAISSHVAHRPAGGLPARLLALGSLWRSRRVLAELDAHRLADLGLTASEASAESNRPVWDVPENWRS